MASGVQRTAVQRPRARQTCGSVPQPDCVHTRVKQSFAWFKKAADLDHVESLTWCGTLYMMGEGADQNSSRSLIMLGRAAALGAEHACYLLGRVHRSGRHGVGIDMQEARRWFAKMPDCSVKDSTLECRESMTAWLRENPAERF